MTGAQAGPDNGPAPNPKPGRQVSESADSFPNTSRVKLHIFLPSRRRIWAVVGKDNEYWADPDLEFCSCKAYYFKTLSNGEQCHHLKTIKNSLQDGSYKTIEFDDSEYSKFTQALLQDMASTIMLGG